MQTKEYLKLVNEPWGQMFYDIINAQLNVKASNKLRILDFGSGFGKTANSFSEFNEVTAIEKSEEMAGYRFKTHDYKQIISDEKILKDLPTNYYDLIICHNVLEYIDDFKEICHLFSKLIKKMDIYQLLNITFQEQSYIMQSY